MFNHNSSMLPAWPRWIETPPWITVTGRHRTSRTNKIASEIAACIGLLVLIDGFCFSYSAVNRAIVFWAKVYDPSWTADGIYACICLGGFFGAMVIIATLTPLVTLFVLQRSTVRFSADAIQLPRRFFGWRCIDRSAAGQLEFFARSRTHVNAYKHEDKHGNVTSGVTAFDLLTVYMRFGFGSEVRLGEFIDEEKSASFMAMCQAAAAATQNPSHQSVPVVTAAEPSPQIAGARARLGSQERVAVRRRLS